MADSPRRLVWIVRQQSESRGPVSVPSCRQKQQESEKSSAKERADSASPRAEKGCCPMPMPAFRAAG